MLSRNMWRLEQFSSESNVSSFIISPYNVNSRRQKQLTILSTVEPPVATTSPQRLVFQNTKSFQVKSLYLQSLVSDHLS